ncbi:MAG TPA: hypothetical protein VFA26_09065 [Gemmataceae bacterium]|nr:hypothetical protein [Gemmataceae bacterium]
MKYHVSALALRVVGLFVGISLVFRGRNWVGLGLGLRTLPSPGAAPGAAP